jgi:hypothetical protein
VAFPEYNETGQHAEMIYGGELLEVDAFQSKEGTWHWTASVKRGTRRFTKTASDLDWADTKEQAFVAGFWAARNWLDAGAPV